VARILRFILSEAFGFVNKYSKNDVCEDESLL